MGMIAELNKSIEAGQPAYVKLAIQPTFGWDTAVGYLTHCADHQLGEPIDILNYRLAGANDVDSIRTVFEYLNENVCKPVVGADLIVTFTTKSATKYHGKNDVILWNAIGYSEFTLLDETDEVQHRFLGPGDIVYLPKNTEYLLKPEMARAIVLFSLE
jgi:hypothetical protein